MLIVEDEWLIAMAAAEALEAAGCEVLGPVISGPEAIAAVRAHAPDAVVLDIRLAGPMNGIETAIVLRQLWNGAIVFHSADNDRTTRDAMARIAGSCTVPKPAPPERLAAAAMALLEHRVAAT